VNKNNNLIILTIFTSILPLIFGIFCLPVLQKLLKISLINNYKLIGNLTLGKLFLLLFQWFISILWLFILYIAIKQNKHRKAIYLLLAFIPIAFIYTLFLTFFFIYYSIVPFAP